MVKLIDLGFGGGSNPKIKHMHPLTQKNMNPVTPLFLLEADKVSASERQPRRNLNDVLSVGIILFTC